MDQVIEILKTVGSWLLSSWGGGITLGGVVVVLVGSVWAAFTPNKVIYNYFYKLGAKLSALGRVKLGKASWEGMENNLTGTFVSAAQGFADGADSDDSQE